jgi:hypothetical protein
MPISDGRKPGLGRKPPAARAKQRARRSAGFERH